MKDDNNMENARTQVEEVTDIMKGNVNKILERDGKLEELEIKASQLQEESQQFQVIKVSRNKEIIQFIPFFQKATVKVKRRAMLENLKMKLALGGAIAAVIIVIVIIIAT